MEGPSMHGYNNEICYHQIHHHDDDPVCVTPNKRRRVSMSARVRFDDRVTVMNQDERGCSPRDNPSEMEQQQQQQQHPPSSLWLTPNDFTKIQNSIFTTLEMMKLTGDFGRDTPLSNRYCARGLENCDLERKGSLTEEALARRRNVIGAVLHEQNIQRKRQMEASLSSSSSRRHNLCNRMGGGYGVQQQQQQQQRDDHHALIQKQGCTKIPEHGGSCVLDHFRIGLICMNLTHGDIMDSIDRGRQDSEEALEIYRTKPLPLGNR
ncbi:unnamed protein product [Pseudo-nitzschia multistriata]|uniref:Uncharacterized protein n=1 Tax=Pseudo-nitzschia multistriata TaxID=183589 RepID=A0A448ZPK5_9STRA|nr:unnamed protein product [Pseudo-nitzschia multistriata]